MGVLEYGVGWGWGVLEYGKNLRPQNWVWDQFLVPIFHDGDKYWTIWDETFSVHTNFSRRFQWKYSGRPQTLYLIQPDPRIFGKTRRRRRQKTRRRPQKKPDDDQKWGWGGRWVGLGEGGWGKGVRWCRGRGWGGPWGPGEALGGPGEGFGEFKGVRGWLDPVPMDNVHPFKGILLWILTYMDPQDPFL